MGGKQDAGKFYSERYLRSVLAWLWRETQPSLPLKLSFPFWSLDFAYICSFLSGHSLIRFIFNTSLMFVGSTWRRVLVAFGRHPPSQLNIHPRPHFSIYSSASSILMPFFSSVSSKRNERFFSHCWMARSCTAVFRCRAAPFASLRLESAVAAVCHHSINQSLRREPCWLPVLHFSECKCVGASIVCICLRGREPCDSARVCFVGTECWFVVQ